MEEELRQCPYDPEHKVRSSRFEIHILKCKRNNDKKENKVCVDACPFNYKHQVLRSDYRHHLVVCPDRYRINIEKALLNSDMHLKNDENYKDEVVPRFETDEDWEKEAKMAPVPTQMEERINPAYSYSRLSKKERREFNRQLIDDFCKNQSGKSTGPQSGYW